MRDSVDFETTPTNECCESIGPKYNQKRAHTEAKATIAQLHRLFGEPPDGSRFRIKSNAHDFGAYYSIEFLFDDDNDQHIDYGCRLENEWPERWDDDALLEVINTENN
jgi:hypothetical protein